MGKFSHVGTKMCLNKDMLLRLPNNILLTTNDLLKEQAFEANMFVDLSQGTKTKFVLHV
jgi:hypothetical protein